MKSDIFGAVTIPWNTITKLISDESLMVVLPDGKAVLGKLAADNNELEVSSQTAKESIAISQVGTIRNADEQKAYERLQHPGILSLWTGYSDLGVSFARGNDVLFTTGLRFMFAR
jgi:hypothetical protein